LEEPRFPSLAFHPYRRACVLDLAISVATVVKRRNAAKESLYKLCLPVLIPNRRKDVDAIQDERCWTDVRG
jgi:hypothetical protein